MAEERRQNELRRKLDRLHHSRQLYEALQAKNHEVYVIEHDLAFKLFVFFWIDKQPMYKNVAQNYSMKSNEKIVERNILLKINKTLRI